MKYIRKLFSLSTNKSNHILTYNHLNKINLHLLKNDTSFFEKTNKIQIRNFNLKSDKFKPTQEEQVLEQKKRNEESGAETELIRDFLDPAEFFKAVQRIGGIDFFCGVPDSLLKGK
jgi:hypothetical protein